VTNRRRPKLVQKLPPAEVLEKSVYELGPFLGTAVYELFSWRPGPPNSGPATEVHLALPVANGVRVALRLKSARALDELVALLLEYRREVFR
jgi:hypothetical protein